MQQDYTLPEDHFLALQQRRFSPSSSSSSSFPSASSSTLTSAPTPHLFDTCTLAAHDFDVDTRSGFMPPSPPPPRLPLLFEPWELMLDRAMGKIQLGTKKGLTEKERSESELWRRHVREMPVIPIESLLQSEHLLRRAHLVLTFLMHFYIHSIPPTLPPSPTHIPRPISLPVLQVSHALSLPPILTYSDTVLYNWKYEAGEEEEGDKSLTLQTTFTRTPSEVHFYLTSLRIERLSPLALSLLSHTLSDLFLLSPSSTSPDFSSFTVPTDLPSAPLTRIHTSLSLLAPLIDSMTRILHDVRTACDPRVFYEEIRPWFKGQPAEWDERWVFEGVDDEEVGLDKGRVIMRKPRAEELSGPSAGQSAVIHALDIFLGVDQFSHAHGPGTPLDSHKSNSHHHHNHRFASPTSTPSSITTPIPTATPTLSPATAKATSAASSAHQHPTTASFLDRMQLFMPRHHRAFLEQLRDGGGSSGKGVRGLVLNMCKEFQDGDEVQDQSKSDLNQRRRDEAMKLRDAYNNCVSALKRFRDEHIKVATLYIVSQSRRGSAAAMTTTASTSSPSIGGMHGHSHMMGAREKEKDRGTGGTELVPFLKGVRDRTAGAIVV